MTMELGNLLIITLLIVPVAGDELTFENFKRRYHNVSSSNQSPDYSSVEEGEMIGMKVVESLYGDLGTNRVTPYYQTEESVEPVTHSKPRHKRAITALKSKYWPRAIVPYAFNDDVPEAERYETLLAMKRYEKFTCVRFVPYVANVTRWELGLPDEAHMRHVKRNGCWAFLGNNHNPKGQTISCCARTACIHELSHIMGVYHDQSSPLRHGWLRINWQNVPLDNWSIFVEEDPETTLAFRYDVTSIMHYHPNAFTSGPWPSMTVLSKDIAPLINGPKDLFYNWQEISVTNQCKARHCPDFPPCENDGFVSYVEGACRCLCPPGLSPDTQCRTVIQKVQSPTTWPSESFTLFSATGECHTDFSPLEIRTPAMLSSSSSDFHLGGNFNRTEVVFAMCVKEPDVDSLANPWQTGQYCVMAGANGNCPQDFDKVTINVTEFALTLCCRDDGYSDDPLHLPIETPFILLPLSDSESCQEVEGMFGQKESLNVRSDTPKNELPSNLPVKDLNYGLGITFCYYEKKDMACGGVVEIPRDAKRVTVISPGYPTAYKGVMECNWLLKSPENTTMIIDFEDFDVGEDTEDCQDDYMTLRYTLLGQSAQKHCGTAITKSFITYENVATVNFHTNLTGHHKGFKAVVKLILPETNCYYIEDRGVSYRGKVNFTKDYQPCLPWDRVTECPHHMFNPIDADGMLEENYCRNPDNSFQPWCYTKTYEGQCDRNYCDVCRYERVYDNQPDCEKLKEGGLCDGDKDQAMSMCAKTCAVPLPPREEPVSCSRPPIIQDAILTSERSVYQVGDTVTNACPYGRDVITRRCHSDGTWSPGNYVCGACSNDWSPHNGACFKFFQHRRTYTGARDFCALHNSYLASPQTYEELDFIVSLRPKLRLMWLGASREMGQADWKSADELKMTLDKWSKVAVTEYAVDKLECAVILAETKNNTFQMMNCNSVRPFVCKRYPTPRRVCVNRRWDCHALVRRNPGVCRQYPDFAWQQCPFTCGICEKVLTPFCTLMNPGPNVVASSDVAYLSRGETISYACANGTALVGGDSSRICEDTGWMSGTAPVCSLLSGESPNNDIDHVERNSIGDPNVAYIGNNSLHRIHKEGEITQWQFYSKDHGTTCLQVWRPRPDLGPDKLEFIGQNEVTTLPNRVVAISVDPINRIRVLPGDLTGVWSGDPPSQIVFHDCGSNTDPRSEQSYALQQSTMKYPWINGIYDVNTDQPTCRTFSLTTFVNETQGRLLSRTAMLPLVPGPFKIRANTGRVFTGDNSYFRIRANGSLIQWQMYAQTAGDVILQVWRARNSEELKYELIGQNNVTLEDKTKQIINIPSLEQIQVEEGDLIALWYPESPGVITFLQCDPEKNTGALPAMFLTVKADMTIGSVHQFTNLNNCRVYELQAVIEVK